MALRARHRREALMRELHQDRGPPTAPAAAAPAVQDERERRANEIAERYYSKRAPDPRIRGL